jgi:hypothetical protein
MILTLSDVLRNRIAAFLYLFVIRRASFTQVSWAENDCNDGQQLYCLVDNNKTKRPSGLSDGRLESVMMVASNYITQDKKHLTAQAMPSH